MVATPRTLTRDLVVVGASAGGIVALPELIASLPADLAASVLVVQHLPTTSPRHLAEIIRRAAKLPVCWAEHGQRLRNAEVMIAPPGTHLLVDGEAVALNEGPRENHSKPSINRLFRSAAASRGAAAIGVLLTGTLDDGVAGLDAINWCGGTTIVQEPGDAEFPDLPRNALEAVAVDHVAPLARIGPLLRELVGGTISTAATPSELQLHAELDRVARADPNTLDRLGIRDHAMCPECGGPLWRLRGAKTELLRCFLGHAMSCRTLMRDQAEGSRTAMWRAVRLLEESALTLASRADEARARGDAIEAAACGDRGERLQAQANSQRRLIAEVEATYGDK
jgi:two-component system, chemotaxis family, protein-glutamate methylesterase/glutaminase